MYIYNDFEEHIHYNITYSIVVISMNKTHNIKCKHLPYNIDGTYKKVIDNECPHIDLYMN